MDRKIRIGAVSYLNTKPLIYGLEREAIRDKIDLIKDYPSNIAIKLIEGTIDIGLVPVSVIDQIPNANIIGDVCIGCNGPVDSVAIFSNTPLDQIKAVILDYQSRTSAALAQVLMREYWKKEVQWIPATNENFRDQIKEGTAALIIGDRALQYKNHSTFMYDLGEAWTAHTGLPFVFACWIANKSIDPEFIQEFNYANRIGLKNLDDIVFKENIDYSDLYKYYTYYIQYELNDQMRRGMALFRSKLMRTNTKV